jgi:hypothetical protein
MYLDDEINIRQKRKKYLISQDIIRTKQDLSLLKQTILPTLERMGISIEKINQFPVRFGEDWEFAEDNDAFYTKKDIVIKKDNKVLKVLWDLTHEYGHEVTLTGGVGTRTNLVGEITAYNFQKIFINNLNKDVGLSLKIIATKPLIERLKNDAVHTIALIFSFVPLGMLIKSKYKDTIR